MMMAGFHAIMISEQERWVRSRRDGLGKQPRV
jgi:hypothetical protein